MSPLSRRGWVLQERAKAPRTLHFGKSQIYWECDGKSSYESFPEGIFNRLLAIPSIVKALMVAGNSNEGWSWWNDVVKKYSEMSLTNEDDELMAISALASRYHEVTGG
jgi:hypothetical protein